MRLVEIEGVFAELFHLFLELHVGSGQESPEGADFLFVLKHLAAGLVLVDSEVDSVLLENFDGALRLEGF